MYIVKEKLTGKIVAFCSSKQDAIGIRDSGKVDKIEYIIEEVKNEPIKKWNPWRCN